MAYVPARKIGVMLLANKRFPIGERVKAALEILLKIDRMAGPQR